MEFFATCSKGLEAALAEELVEIGCGEAQIGSGGVAFSGELERAYGALLWSRVASRILAVLAVGEASDDLGLYEFGRTIDWSQHLGRDATIAVDFTGAAAAVDNSLYGAQRIKDALVDQLRERSGWRPSVDKADPGVRINVHAAGPELRLSIDLCGGPMHRRGYRRQGVAAPLKETLAAGLLRLAGYKDQPLCDPMCGSGTFVIEAALMLADVAPGLLRGEFGSKGWLGHQPELWQSQRAEARARDRRRQRPAEAPRIVGRDRDPRAIRVSESNAMRAGVSAWIELECGELAQAVACGPSGLMIVNPPYGERLGEVTSLQRLYLELGDVLKGAFGGWRAGVLSNDKQLAQAVGLKAASQHAVFNGPLRCRLLLYEVVAREGAPSTSDDPLRRIRRLLVSGDLDPFANRLRKNARHLAKWARRNDIGCYRVYDADLPEFASAIDRYEDALVISEYAPPSSVDPERAEARLRDTTLVAGEILEIDPARVFTKVRQRQRGSAQYERQSESQQRVQVHEAGQRLWVNLSDYLDTGLFLHHRQTRQLLAAEARGRSLLNLFCYTGVATVQAAAGGCASSLSLDLSRTYLEWARENFELNRIDPRQHEVRQADCLAWIDEEGRRGGKRFDCIFCDPPSFSNSKRMNRTLDIQRDHAELILSVVRLLRPGGVLIFSTNKRRFALEEAALKGLQLRDITAETTSEDFRRAPQHRCWRIEPSR